MLSGHILEGDFLSLQAEGRMQRKFDCIVGNPPYVSLHRMELEQRTRAWAAISLLGGEVDRKASLWAYFIIAALKGIREGGRLAMVLPETTLHAAYARKVIRDTSRHFHRLMLVSIRERCFRSGGANERVVLLLGETFHAERADRDVLLHECATASEAQSFISTQTQIENSILPRMNGHAVPHLLSAKNTAKFDLDGVHGSHRLEQFADIKIGVVTGANDFFLLTEAVRRKWRIPDSALKPILPRFQSHDGLIFEEKEWTKARDTGDPCWMLVPSAPERRKTVLAYIDQMPEELRTNNKTFAKRDPWFRPQIGEPSHAFFRYMGASAPRLMLAGFDAVCTNSIHRIYFHPGTTALRRKAIALSLHSSFSQLSAELEGRSYGSGVLKLEPSEARRVRLLLPACLDRVTVQRLFREVEQAMSRGNVEHATESIDAWLYESLPGLANEAPLQQIREALNAARERRTGCSIRPVDEEIRRSN